MSKLQRIFIVGHMGAFKSTLGRALAEKLSWQYIEANPGLERYIGRSLHEILGTEGEAAFHQCEAEIIAHYIEHDHVVVVLEEAVVVSAENRRLLASEFVIYSTVSIPVQLDRMSIGMPPLLPIQDPKAFLEKLHHERDSFFEEIATISIEPTFVIESDINQIIKAIETY